jgi:serine/threonine-protein phosphatase 2A regulatory subunit B'
LPVVKKTGVAGEVGMDEEEIIDPSWPHLQPVYEFFLQLIVNDAADVRSLKGFITHKFI